MTCAVVIGHGSIGQRHAEVLRDMGHDVRVVSRRAVAGGELYSNIEDAVGDVPDAYAVVADETARHGETLRALRDAGHRGPVLVEKPLFSRSEPLDGLDRDGVFVGYSLRFHDLVAPLRDRLAARDIYTAEVVVGQYLPDWRPGRDYRSGYSARPADGGGVLRDLSHEIDLLLWLLGPWKRVAALVGRSGALEIDSEDYAHVLVEGVRYRAATLGLDYLDRNVRRSVTIQSDAGTLVLDFVAGTLVENGDVVAEARPARNDAYRRQHEAVLAGDTGTLCTLAQGSAVVSAFEAIERAAENNAWQVV